MTNIYILLLLGAVLETQTNWYTGPGNHSSLLKWGSNFDTCSNIVYSLPNQISLKPYGIDTNNWKLYTIETNALIGGHNLIVPADIDLDGHYDLVGAFSKFVVWYKQGTSFAFTKHIIDTTLTVGTNGTIWPYDLDRDGDSDIVASGDKGFFWFENNNTIFTRHQIISSVGWFFARTADIDNDGDVDIVAQKFDSAIAGNKWEGTVYIFKNDGSMNFTSSKLAKADTTWRTNFADFNNDGFLDIQTSAYNAKSVRVYLNDGAGNFNLIFRYTNGKQLDGSWPSDVNADGFMDISVSAQSGDFFWLENNGLGNNFIFHPVTSGVTKYGDGGMAVDIDMSDKVDIIGGYHAIGWFEQGTSGFKEHFLGNATDCHWVYGCNMGKGPCGEVSDIAMDILYTDKGKFAFWKNLMVKGYEDHAWLESSILDVSKKVVWLRFGWHDCVPDGYSMTYRVRCGLTIADVESSSWSMPISYSGDSLKGILPAGRYFQYRVEMDDWFGNAGGVAIVDTIWVEYEEPPTGIAEAEQKKALSCSYNIAEKEIDYTLAKESNVSFRIYDITGRVVSVIDAENKKAGNHTLEFNFPTGIYLVKLICNTGTVTVKCVVME